MSDIDIAVVDRPKALDLNRPIREADITEVSATLQMAMKRAVAL